MNRREFLQCAASWLALALPARRASAFLSTPQFSENPFTLGVASGDPLPDGVVLWTRLLWESLRDNVAVAWEVAEDEQFRRIVKTGRATARPELAHSVHVEVTGLRPARWYHYRFHASGVSSPTGRTRTAPAAGARLDRLQFAFASCQSYQEGYYTAYKHLVQEEIELVVFLGDYIYEVGRRPNAVRSHADIEVRTLPQYRDRYAIYKSDPLLQEAHRLYPWIVVWDDHEVANNWAGRFPAWAQADAGFLERRASAAKAYYEHMPLRRASIPRGPDMQLFRRLDYGDLARFHVLDTRQYRSRQACGDGVKNCPETFDPSRTILGHAQEQWLFDGLQQSRARWNILANQIMMTKVDRAPGTEEAFAQDEWAGYEQSRRRLAEFLEARRPSGPLVITGNNHVHFVGEIKADFRNPNAPAAATELLGTSIASGGDPSPTNPVAERFRASLAENPQVKYYEDIRGYVVCRLDRDQCTADFRGVRVAVPDQPLNPGARFLVEQRRPGAARV
jgi:alkaline phosphatase D